MINLIEIFSTIFYASIGILLMVLGVYVFDLIVPYNFKDELKENNIAAGFIMAGIFIAIAIIIRTIII